MSVMCFPFVCVLGMMVKTVFGLGEHVTIQVKFVTLLILFVRQSNMDNIVL